MANLESLFDSFQPRELLTNFISGEYYELVFPFLLIFAVFYTALSSEKIKLFRNSDKLNKAGVFIVSLVVSLFSIYFETSEGYTIGKLSSLLFPNISTLTVLLLGLYVVGALFGKNFFKGMFGKKYDAYAHILIGALGLGAVVFYVGIAMGFFNYDPYHFAELYNVTLAIAFGILGLVFLIMRLIGFGLILLFVLGIFISNDGDGFILEYFFDPIMFIAIIIIFLLTWLGTDKEKKEILKIDLLDQKDSMEGYLKRNNRELEDYESRLRDITSTNYDNNKKKWDKLYPGESWED